MISNDRCLDRGLQTGIPSGMALSSNETFSTAWRTKDGLFDMARDREDRWMWWDGVWNGGPYLKGKQKGGVRRTESGTS